MKLVSLWLDSPVDHLDNSAMSKFSDWVEAKYRRATDLAEHFGRTTSFVSNVKAGRKCVPKSWYADVLAMSDGELTLSDLISHGPPLKRGTR